MSPFGLTRLVQHLLKRRLVELAKPVRDLLGRILLAVVQPPHQHSQPNGVANAIVQGGLIGRLVPRFGEKPLAVAGLALQAVGFAAIVVAPAFWTLYPISIVSSAGAGLIYPALAALMANQVPPHEQGQVAGVGTALSGLMSMFGPLWAGAAYDRIAPGAPFWSGAIVLALAAIVLAQVRTARLAAALEA